MRIEIVADVKTRLGESPMWDWRGERIYWADTLGGVIYSATVNGSELRAWDLPATVGSFGLRERGGAVLAMRSGLHFLDFDTGEIEFVAHPEPDYPDHTLNDGKVDRQGRFVFGSMDISESGPNAALYHLEADRAIERIESGITISNGPCWSPDGLTFYFADSLTPEIRAYDYDPVTGQLSNRRAFAPVLVSGGAADGATVDAEGGIWSAQAGSGLLVRYAPDGRVDRTVTMPVRFVTSVMFGGPKLDTLFVTSMARPLRRGDQLDPISRGSLFAVHDLGVSGLPEPLFRG